MPLPNHWYGVAPTQLPQTRKAPPREEALFNIVTRDWFVNLRTNPECPVGRFSVWTGLQGAEDVGSAIAASDADMASLDRRNSQADHIFWAERVVLWFLVGPLTT